MNLHVSRSLGLARSQEPLGSEDLTVPFTHTVKVSSDVMDFLKGITNDSFIFFNLIIYFIVIWAGNNLSIFLN